MSTIRIAVIMTCFNRRDQTLACMHSLHSQDLPAGTELDVWLVDDGSTDDTSSAVAYRYPSTHVIHGDGSLFWCGGMRLAWKHAAETRPDAILWLNDDVKLLPDALATLLDVHRQQPEAVVVGSCRCPTDGGHAYGGQRRSGKHPGRVTPVIPASHPVECDTFEGNIVLIPAAVYDRVGGMEEFKHAMADTDYGYRVTKCGYRILVAPGHIGECERNQGDRAWQKPGLGPLSRLRLATSVKGLPPRDWWHFCFQHGGLLAPAYFIAPYLKALLGK